MYDLITDSLASKLLASISLFFILFVFRLLAFRTIKAWKIGSLELRLKYQTMVRHILLVIFLLSMVIFWGHSIKGFAISIAAFAAALVLATKELFQCFLGSIVKVSNHVFTLGDRIQVGGVRGIVISQSFLGTTVMEMGPGETMHQLSGKRVFIPNSQFLTQTIKNESLGGEFIFHTFFIGLKSVSQWKTSQDNLMQACQQACRPFGQDAKKAVSRYTKDKDMYSPSTEPKVSIDLSEAGKVKLIVRIICKEQEANRIEQDILRKYLEKLSQ